MSVVRAQEATVRFRAMMLLIALGIGVVVPLVEAALGHFLLVKTLWLVGAGITAFALRVRPPSGRVRGLIAGTMVLLGPLSVACGPASVADLATIGMMPLIAGVLFIRALDVVVVVTICGQVGNAVLFSSLGWPANDVLSVMLRLVAGSGVLVFAAYWSSRLRALDLAVEAEQGKALRLSESRRAQAERLAIVGRLAAGVAHEINNPIAFVKANVGVLERHLINGEHFAEAEVKEVLAETREGIERVCQIILDLKSYARDDTDVLEEVNLEASVRQAVRLASVRLPPSTAVAVELPPQLPSVRVNQRKLAQVLLNLLINAGDALEEAQTRDPAIRVTAALTEQALRLTVKDNGPGLSPEALTRVFEPFFTTKGPGKGTGLGLALSREYVAAFQGTLTAENCDTGGAAFTLTLPVPSLTPSV